MELKKGMYARTEDGEILKIKHIEDVYTSDGIYIANVIYFGDCFHINSDEVIKASHNIIDLIEVGDYVNGFEVEFIDNENKNIICYTATFDEEDIKSIVTKEQFEAMEYKLGDE